jgi:hypothetical protein
MTVTAPRRLITGAAIAAITVAAVATPAASPGAATDGRRYPWWSILERIAVAKPLGISDDAHDATCDPPSNRQAAASRHLRSADALDAARSLPPEQLAAVSRGLRSASRAR